MKVVDEGHQYLLNRYDGEGVETLEFVKREGENYPGNEGTHPGTNLQEVFRACISRLKYLRKQEPNAYDDAIVYELKIAIWLLEMRAAERHGRTLKPNTFDNIEFEPTCTKCGHIQCGGECGL